MASAINGMVSTDLIEGGIEITEQQYLEAIEGMAEGKLVSIDGGFSVAFPPEPEPEPQPEPTLADAIAERLAELDAYRWEREVGGVEFGGALLRTDANSQAKVAAAYTGAKLDPDYYVPTWEVAPGVFMPLDNATIIAMGEAVRDHVQATFNRKAELHAQISALPTLEAALAFDVAEAW